MNGDGYTDFVFFGYANSPTGSSTGWQGGIGKINTNNTDTSAALNPQNWTYDVTTYGGLAEQPITAAVEAEQCLGTWYLYSGQGGTFSRWTTIPGPVRIFSWEYRSPATNTTIIAPASAPWTTVRLHVPICRRGPDINAAGSTAWMPRRDPFSRRD